MKSADKSWLLPSGLTGYVALAAVMGQDARLSWLALLIPVALAWSLRKVAQRFESGHFETGLSGIRLVLIGTALFAASWSGSPDSA